MRQILLKTVAHLTLKRSCYVISAELVLIVSCMTIQFFASDSLVSKIAGNMKVVACTKKKRGHVDVTDLEV